MDNTSSRKPIVGKYILDTLSIGMYNNPLMLIREYVQNSVDAIDEFRKKDGSLENHAIEIRIDGRNRVLTISDNGIGLSYVAMLRMPCMISAGASRKFLWIEALEGLVGSAVSAIVKP